MYDELHETGKEWYFYAIKAVAAFEVVYLSVRVGKTKFFFSALQELDDKMFSIERGTVKNKNMFFIASPLVFVALDSVAMKVVGLPNSVVVLVTLAFSVTDSELSFYASIAEMFRKKLEAIIHMNPKIGFVLYTRLLLSAISFSRGFHNQALLRLLFVWRELRSLFYLWIFSWEVERTSKLCERLRFRLGERIAFDRLDGDVEFFIRRWLSCLNSKHLQTLIGTTPVVNAYLPYKIIDWTCNYIIIIVQIYMAYN
ncbi:unnamed protein product [Leptosia nina]|uniref:Uncharacterized protein n=1 Tax=Leptosia nina TaxID=320188 RepID=A0AAV1JY53_9NEOP